MSKRLVAYDEITGLETWHDYDPQTEEMTIGYSANSKPILELNTAMRNSDDLTKKGIKQEFWLYASIPVAVQIDWLINKGVDVYNKDHAKKVFELVNDPDFRGVKTTTKHHSARKYG